MKEREIGTLCCVAEGTVGLFKFSSPVLSETDSRNRRDLFEGDSWVMNSMINNSQRTVNSIWMT